MNWDHATAVILTCNRDCEIVSLCQQGIRLFWPGMNIAVLHDTEAGISDLPDDVWAIRDKIPYLRKVFDLPWVAPTDQIYCIDSDCFLVAEPTDWAPAAHLAVGPGSAGQEWLDQGAEVWKAVLGYSPIATDHIFCGGCWSADRRKMFGEPTPDHPKRKLAIEYVRECVRRGYDKAQYPGPVMEQCLLNGLWHLAYGECDCHLVSDRYPLYAPNPRMVLYHLSNTARSTAAPKILDAYREVLRQKAEQLKETPHEDQRCHPLPQPG